MTPAKKWLIVAPTVVLAAGAFVAWPYLPKRYQSETTLAVVPQRVPETYVPSAVTQKLEDRLRSVQHWVLSRTNLERVIRDLQLYPMEVRHLPIEDVVERMRGDVQVEVVGGDTVRVAYINQIPKKASDVVSRLAALFVDGSEQDRAMLTNATSAFLNGEVDATRRRLIENEKQLEQARIGRNAVEVRLRTLEEEVLESTYKSLLAKAEEAKLSVSLATRSLGESFRTLEPARVPERPLGLARLETTFVGAVAGLILGLALVVVTTARSAGQARRAKP